MIDARQILTDLQNAAEAAAKDFDLTGKAEDARAAAAKLRERIDADPNARLAAFGAGGLLLAGLLGTRGGRDLIGGVAKTGAVAALGALAYKAWNERNKGAATTGGDEAAAAGAAGFPTNPADDPAFALAVVKVMLAAAHADGEVSSDERQRIHAALDRVGATPAERESLFGPAAIENALASARAAARSPNHAAELYAAAAVMIESPGAAEAEFLTRLADALGVDASQANAIHRAIA